MACLHEEVRITMKTPVTVRGLEAYDHLPPIDAIVAAWVNPGANPGWHYAMQDEVRMKMPLLARALDRLAK